jgi:large repetitive protein
VSSSRQEQTFSAWSTDNLNGGNLYIHPPEILICEGDPVDSLFSDQSTFNCNIAIEPDKPNRLHRWVQFVYNTDMGSPDLIPNASVVDPLGNVYPLTNAMGAGINMQYGPIVPVPIPADGPNQDSWRIVAPSGAVAGDFIEVTMRNWNICNPYDKDPYDLVKPADTLNGDNLPLKPLPMYASSPPPRFPILLRRMFV